MEVFSFLMVLEVLVKLFFIMLYYITCVDKVKLQWHVHLLELLHFCYPKGQTTHSYFKIPLDLTALSTCNITVNSSLAEVLKLAKLIICDEAPMTHLHAFEALGRTIRDVMQKDVVFGGKVVLLGGDFRQVLFVVLKGSQEDIIDATLCKSQIWRHVIVLQLSQNMHIL